jgi:hypothetical protein
MLLFSHYKALYGKRRKQKTVLWLSQSFTSNYLTLQAFLTYGALSFSRSWWDLIGFFSSLSTTMPGPCTRNKTIRIISLSILWTAFECDENSTYETGLTWVQEPPMKVMILAPVFGYVHWKDKRKQYLLFLIYARQRGDVKAGSNETQAIASFNFWNMRMREWMIR